MKRRIPLNALQKGVYSILTQYQMTQVYDSVPQGAEFPYITFSDYEYDITGSKDSNITELMLEIEIWSDYSGKSAINDIAEDIVNVLTDWPIDLSADGFRLISKDVKGGKGARAAEEFYGVVYFTARVQDLGSPS